MPLIFHGQTPGAHCIGTDTRVFTGAELGELRDSVDEITALAAELSLSAG